ncbi:hypothetical protein AVEN_252371-1 [Araneus ventricosus]|uniref:CCHC-type domain-containing protein n=1 Tax=Araneus ventricosus TaxID=182803 RepID=A0A4Y2ARQ2_ARAVE|nr:hypothetical protein AVEN_252371-1 [Araneus ventricosus]
MSRAGGCLPLFGSVVRGAVGPESPSMSHGKKSTPFSGHHIAQYSLEKHFYSFFVIQRTTSDNKETFHTVSPFLVEKAISSAIGEVASIKKLRSGDLLVEVTSRKQAQQILKLKALATVPLCTQGVIHVRRITIRRDGKLLETKHLILTFNSPKSPESIKAGYIKLPVKPFIPNPLGCFKCQRFGHSNATCRGTLTCARCAVAGHESTNCEATEQCVNCKGKHNSFSRSCPKRKFEKEIITTKVKQDISFSEAIRLVQAQTPTLGRSYASATKTFKACETQTKHVVILTTDSDQISSPTKRKSTFPFKKKKSISKSQKALALKVSKAGASLKDLKLKKSITLASGKAGPATKDLPSFFGNPSNSELLKIHTSEDDDDDLQMS